MTLYREGKIKPINITSYHITEIGDAIRYFAEGKHTGKIIIDYTQKIGTLKVGFYSAIVEICAYP